MEPNLVAERISEANLVSAAVDPKNNLPGSGGVTGLSLVNANGEIVTDGKATDVTGLLEDHRQPEAFGVEGAQPVELVSSDVERDVVQSGHHAAPIAGTASAPGGSDAGAALVDSLLPRPARFFICWAVPARFRAARTSAVTL